MTRATRHALICQLDARITRLYRLVAIGLITKDDCNEAQHAIAHRIGSLKQAGYEGGVT